MLAALSSGSACLDKDENEMNIVGSNNKKSNGLSCLMILLQ
jgi:hypothetical protein